MTLQLPNPETNPNGRYHRVNDTFAYNYRLGNDIRTLSTNGIQPGSDVTGLLYTPQLEENGQCYNASAEFTADVTTLDDLPKAGYDLVAIAPWISPNCVGEYLEQARRDRTVRGFLFFLPDDHSTETPPSMNSNEWWLGDGGQWKRENNYPVYALPGDAARTILRASEMYSKNITEVPWGENLTEQYDAQDYVRLYIDIDTKGSGNNLPSLWIFLLIVLGILLSVIGVTSLVMHYLQRRRRLSLRRRVANGEVDLEALGIKRLTVPQHILDEMPLYKYGSRRPLPPSAANTALEAKTLESASSSRPSSPDPNARPTPAGHHSYQPTPQDQPTCAICLDDYVPASDESEGTTVRELPCHHIFHPECVDSFLKDNSSLCPICKRTALPKGYCPKNVTNAMVRRERMQQRVRTRQPAHRTQTQAQDAAEAQETEDSVPPLTIGRRIRNISGLSRPGRRISSAPTPSSQAMTEMTAPAPAMVRSQSARSQSATRDGGARNVQPPSTPGRREWARQRALTMLGRRPAPADPDEEDRGTPRWRKALRGVFPGFGR